MVETSMNGENVRDLLARLEAEQADGREAEELRHWAAVEAELKRLNEKIERLTKPEPERRRSMTAARKSQLIRKLGIEAYNRLPW
jgi:hypothetical protein